MSIDIRYLSEFMVCPRRYSYCKYSGAATYRAKLEGMLEPRFKSAVRRAMELSAAAKMEGRTVNYSTVLKKFEEIHWPRLQVPARSDLLGRAARILLGFYSGFLHEVEPIGWSVPFVVNDVQGSFDFLGKANNVVTCLYLRWWDEPSIIKATMRSLPEPIGYTVTRLALHKSFKDNPIKLVTLDMNGGIKEHEEPSLHVARKRLQFLKRMVNSTDSYPPFYGRHCRECPYQKICK